ncbi:MAG TPA: beta-ketoacyl synthase N-terminal-like domain-containing protein, partial [Rhodocyclaceae bacterium]|nr:beta-ketoacyl synthase N-terminal-like domain-containing protein [Rhodocyclaceae bacterium]
TRLRELVAQTVAQADATQERNIPLYIASSSLDTGAIENGMTCTWDCNFFAASLAECLDWRGPVFTVSTACTSSINALLSASRQIQRGMATDALVLSMELASPFAVGGFTALQLLAPERALPFGHARNGLVLGEAVVALRLSDQPSRWRIRGGANVVDGSDPTGAVKQAVVDMCRRALDSSGLTNKDIDLIKVQAAGSPTSDAAEAAGLRQIFTRMPALVTLKTALGHTLGASGAAEIALLTACLEKRCLPRMDHRLDDAIGIKFANTLPPRVRYVLTNILGFGGGHAAFVLEDTEAAKT